MSDCYKVDSDLQSSLPNATDELDKNNASLIPEVQGWLNSVFEAAGKEVPEFEYTTSVINHLHRIAKISQARTQAAQVVASDLWEKANEYRVQAAKIRERVDGMGLAPEYLSMSALTSAKAIGGIANSLSVRDCETSSLLIGIAKLGLQKVEVEEKRAEIQKESDILLENTRKGITLLTYLKRTLAELEEEATRRETSMEHRIKNMKLMEAKRQQYDVQLANFKALLTKVGYKNEISHGELMQLDRERKELDEKTKPLLHALRTYQDLPPDKILAELVIEDKKRECEVAEKTLEDLLHAALSSSAD